MAELTIGCISFLFQVFSGCVTGIEIITDASNLDKDFQYLRVRMKFEQYRLLDWAEIVGIDYTDEKLILNKTTKALVLDLLEQQNILLAQFGRRDTKYKRFKSPLLVELAEEFDGSHSTVSSEHLLENGARLQKRDTDLTRFPQAKDLLKKSLDFSKKFKDVPRRLKWASWDKAKMETLIEKLSMFNDQIRQELNTAQLGSLVDKQRRTEYQVMQLNNNLQNLVQIFQSQVLTVHLGQPHYTNGRSIMPVEESEYGDYSSENRPRLPASQGLAALAQFKAISYAIEHPNDLTQSFTQAIELSQSPREICDAELALEDIRPQDTDEFPEEVEEGQRTEAVYKDRSVWIEWKMSEPAAVQPDGLDPQIEVRVKKLATLLKENNRTEQFRAPRCFGYFREKDVGRFGLVFEKPQTVPNAEAPQSLYSLLTDANVEIPSLTDRVTLMRLLSETIERLHAVNWLHKGLRSANILFFKDPSTQEINYSQPYISGFDYSRPAMNDEMTEKPPENAASDIYRHPMVQSNGNRESTGDRPNFKKSHDLYSLGILLMEIAYWQPVNKILDIVITKDTKPSITYKVRERLLEEKIWLNKVKSYLGNTVESVVRACLEGPTAFGLEEECDEKREEVGAELQRMFAENVVERLAQMKGL
ncbi:hypothetical protein P153DRAFT_420427 [Dothidotthia symphoricarpi CBS 119687]|uniref:Protein kinase domain-containing protein n=1 Tax=Dothidotthia symphoricarpi CBS 119687 TaxID=1392245 RepID=A0A6A6AP65_9PLEO|nr:uncharacterized protein P153DRAFT_420427 [Dothidotthia symphoricarpi CBS 119687]KAF2133590.1 hypothetical protein P153DRAFT_420427 [Dothidotthia symphoricarpi CBS 119687]